MLAKQLPMRLLPNSQIELVEPYCFLLQLCVHTNKVPNLGISYYICNMRYRMRLSYDGADFCGWQIQPDAPSVQGRLEEALSMLLRCTIAVTGAGRTDSGVNASDYIAHFDCENALDCQQLCYKLNAILPDSISITSIEEANSDFHARFSAKHREYKYYLHRGKAPFLEKYSYRWPYPELDIEAMNRAAQQLLGTHDFSCFEKSGGDNKTSICTIFQAEWHKYCPQQGSESECWYFHIAADRFLRNMVRAIVGTLLEIGRGKRAEGSIEELIRSQDRCQAGQSVPGHALFLTKIEY